MNSLANGGYYIGRFEAGDLESTEANTARTDDTSDENTLVCKANQRVYNYVTQSQASSLSQNMYKEATTFTSDLINSYAWDTAIIFIQTFGNCEDYYNRNFSTSFANTGVNNDKYCNIYDMSGNYAEFSTETLIRPDPEELWGTIEGKIVSTRGGYKEIVENGGDPTLAGDRWCLPDEDINGKWQTTFRPVIYF